MFMEFDSVNAYLDKLRRADGYKSLAQGEREAEVFTAGEMLKDYFPEDKITDRAVALQVLYNIEGESETYAMLKRQGVKSYSVKDVSVTFEGSGISPDVINLLQPKRGASVGRMI